MPDIWKTAMIVPIHKKDPSTSAANFRPTSLDSSISKLMERVIANQITPFLTAHNLISLAQFDFQARSSTVIWLNDSYNGWLSSQNIYDSTEVIFLDYAKAFDSVSHGKLVHKLHAYGIRKDLLR